ncbi:MAG: hypothetical protein JXR48_09790 [Candidatus Delongbacteria bacterium]|nr:hypothetical protein [Candidatus Delongbacteria bacterium]MBN2835245.1 hypothetical protein [Candidatus Delongbacteria bacterium]
MVGLVEWIEWKTTDIDKTANVLEKLFGWKFDKWSPDYFMFQPEKGAGVGLIKLDTVNAGYSPINYITVGSIDKTIDEAKNLGLIIKLPKSDIPNIGWHSLLQDYDGNVFGLFERINK